MESLLEEQINAIKADCLHITKIKNPSEIVQLASVNNWAYSIEYINNPSEEVQLAAVKNIPRSIYYIANPTEKVKIEAVTNDAGVIAYIKNPSEELQLISVREFNYNYYKLDDFVKKYIKSPKALQLYERLKKAKEIII